MKDTKTLLILAAAAAGLAFLAFKSQQGPPQSGRPWTGFSAWPKAFWSPSSG